MTNNIRAALLFLALTACAAALPEGKGCATYSIQRADMPALSDDAVSRWVAVMDSAMTGACR